MTRLATSEIPEELPDPGNVIQCWIENATQETLDQCYDVWCGESSQDVYFLGRNEASQILLDNGVHCAGLIDDYTTKTSHGGVPILRFEQIQDTSSIIVNCVQCNLAVEAEARVRSSPYLRGLSFSDFFRASLLSSDSLPRFSSGTHAALQRKADLYTSLWRSLSDQNSRKVFYDILRFRLTTDPVFLQDYRYRPSEQYFEDFLTLPSQPIFVDAGAFDGETSIEFARRYPKYAQIYAFEPSDANADIMEKRVSSLRRIRLYRYGLSDVGGFVRFAAQQGSASKASEFASSVAPMIPLDDMRIPDVSLIKMDLEGGELKALLGAQNTIQRCKPCLAIAAYHEPEDFAELHKTISSMLPTSRFYLRHYTSGWAETVLYCISDE
jgi:FkbM family methyltransferase